LTLDEKLKLLKSDLQKMSDSDDIFLTQLLQHAAFLIAEEGIKLDDSLESSMLEVQYAAYLFRKRAAQETAMPRFLRYSLNNRLLNQKGGEGNGGT